MGRALACFEQRQSRALVTSIAIAAHGGHIGVRFKNAV